MRFAAYLQAKRVALGPLGPEQRDFFVAINSDEAVRRYLGGPVPADQLEARFQLSLAPSPEMGVWLVTTRAALEPVGLVMLGPHKDGADHELSYLFDPKVWGQGMAFDAARAVLDHGLHEIGLARILAETQSANLRSCALLDRLGMREQKRFKRFGARQILYST